MAVYLTTTITLKDMEKFQEYATGARPTLIAHGGEPVMIGRVAGTLHGEAGHHMEVVFRFADRETLEAWYNSPEYQALIPLRDAGADVVFKIVEDI